MDYQHLLDITTQLGYELAMNGAETYRVEETITRICAAYGIDAEVFAIPNCLTVSLETPEHKSLTRVRRIGHHGTDMDFIERYNQLSRRICAEKPDLKTAEYWIAQAKEEHKQFPLWAFLLGNIMVAAGFVFAYNGGVTDTVYGAMCGLAAGLISYFMSKLKVNIFFSTITSAFVMGLVAHTAETLGLLVYTDGVIISSLMLLVPGLLFTNALRDIIYGDTNSGINRIVQVLLIGVAIALGIGFSGNLLSIFHDAPIVNTPVEHSILAESLTTFVACCGFLIVFNIHGKGGFLCALGGALTWALFRISHQAWDGSMLSYFTATFFAAAYSEIVARIRKCPAISYLVISVIPLLPGAGVYRTTAAIMEGNMPLFSSYAIETIAIAGAMAVGILIVSTLARLWSIHQQKHKKV